MRLSEWELWACAARAIETHGDRAKAFAASRIDALTNAGDAEGVLAWTLIGDRIERLEGEMPQSALVN